MGTLGKLDGNRQAATFVTCSQYFDFVMLTTVTVFYEDQWEGKHSTHVLGSRVGDGGLKWQHFLTCLTKKRGYSDRMCFNFVTESVASCHDILHRPPKEKMSLSH